MTNQVVARRSEAAERRDHGARYLRAFGCTTALISIALSLIANVDPRAEAFGLQEIPIMRHSPSIIMILAGFLLLLAGVPAAIFRSREFWVALVLCCAQLGGAYVTIIWRDASLAETYLGRGLAATAVMSGILFGAKIQARRYVMQHAATVGMSTSVVAAIIGVLFGANLILSNLSQVHHEESLYVCAGLMLLASRSRSGAVAMLGLATMVYIAISGGKITGYLLAATFVIVIYVSPILHKLTKRVGKGESGGSLSAYVLILSVTIFMIVFAYVAWEIAEAKMFTNMSELRRMLWSSRWQQFVQSPIIGTMFYGSPLVSVPMLPGMQIPTHNDWLDILAFGGVVGVGLFLVLLLAPIFSRQMWEALDVPHGRRAYQHYPAFIVLAYLATALGNPLLDNPFVAVPVWFAIGMMNGVLFDRRMEARRHDRRKSRKAMLRPS